MKTKELRLYAGNVVMESKLSNQAKIQILEFLKDAKSTQIKSFLLDGKIMSLDEQAEQIVNDRFKVVFDEASTVQKRKNEIAAKVKK